LQVAVGEVAGSDAADAADVDAVVPLPRQQLHRLQPLRHRPLMVIHYINSKRVLNNRIRQAELGFASSKY
jgi:hypothetical protein